jgi:hypothetical protein
MTASQGQAAGGSRRPGSASAAAFPKGLAAGRGAARKEAWLGACLAVSSGAPYGSRGGTVR